MTWKKMSKYMFIILLVLVSIFALFMFGGYSGDLFDKDTESLSSNQIGTAVFSEGMQLNQTLIVKRDYLSEIMLPIAIGTEAHIHYQVMADEKILIQGEVNESLTKPELLLFRNNIDVKGYKNLKLKLTALPGNTLQFFYGNQIILARGAVPITDLTLENSLSFNNEVLPGKLNLQIVQYTPYNVVIPICILFTMLFLGWAFLYWHAKKHYNTGNFLTRSICAIDRYYFLLQQLVSRDFKSKYKRSILGVVWSFLNPLLTMAIQYVVFSTLFKSSIPYFPIYLLSGTICFSIFTESTSLGLTSISGNASLLTKVYIPKYIFPFSSVITSIINFAFTLIPLIAVVLIVGLPITTAWFFIPYTILCLISFCLGMALLLASVMVFFRDIQFIWGVLTTLMIYAIPVFYPETIIPDSFSFLYKMNPVYHVIRIMRTIFIDGAPPTPHALIVCTLACGLVFIIGTFTFKKTQDKFVLYL